MTKQEFIFLANKNKCVFLIEQVDGVTIRYKALGTWIQILDILKDGVVVHHSNYCDEKVSEYKKFTQESIFM